MKTSRTARFAAVVAFVLVLPALLSAATIGASLQKKLTTALPADPLGTVIVSFNDNGGGLTASHLSVLRAVGISSGRHLKNLGMVATPATAAQVRSLASNPAVRSVWLNDPIYYFMHQARVLTGVERVETHAPFTAANGGLPLSGKGNFSVVVNDSGIDATHADLAFGEHVIQNVQIVTDENTPNSVVEIDPSFYGFTPLGYVENVPNTDTHIGHGTHCAGIIGGNGARSGGLFRGVAPGAKLIGLGSGAVQYILAALGGFEWSLVNQPRYNIRVISNSWGGGGAFNPDDPVNIASKRAADRNIVVVFAAGNEGPAPDTHNPYAKAPWVISVAAGTKEGGLASFSSRGTPKATRLANSDPNDDFDAPTITAPGTGREFPTNSAKFTQAVVSTRSSSNVVANGLTSDAEINTAQIPFYTQISGTSMATPHVAGIVALMLEAKSTLTPAEVKDILVRTATRMPGYDEWEVGAGYVNAFAAVDLAFNPGNSYAVLGQTSFNAQVSIVKEPAQAFTIDYSPSATPGPNSANARPFTVAPGVAVLEVTIEYAKSLEASLGNLIILRLYAPDGTQYSNAGSVVFVTDDQRRYLKIVNPQPGTWIVEPRGARGLAAVPQASSPTAIAAPDNIDVTIARTRYDLGPVSDIAGHALEADIRTALSFRFMDADAAGAFRPDEIVNRMPFVIEMLNNLPVRQPTGASGFSDIGPGVGRLASAVTANGAALRQWDYREGGLLGTSGSAFNPTGTISRLDLAIALVRGLGCDAQAQALRGATVTAKNSAGATVAIADLLDIPADQRGYAQLAIDKGFVTPRFGAFGEPLFVKAGTVTRAELAYAIVAFRDFFSLQ